MEKINLRLRCVVLSAFLLSGCSTAVITPQGYEMVPKGAPVEYLEQSFGTPYEITVLDNGIEECTYLARIPISPGVVDQVTYKFYVKDGKVVDKLKKSENCAGSVTFR